MSLFLAPIHKMMYDKIHFLEDLANQLANEDILKQTDELLGEVIHGELSEVVDHNNIHGWLNEQVILVEKRFSFIVEKLLESGERLEELLLSVQRLGEKELFSGNAKEAFMAINARFLDGMPCDMVLKPIAMGEDKVIYQITKDVHGGYWKNQGLYQVLRDAWTEGFLGKSVRYSREDDMVTMTSL